MRVELFDFELPRELIAQAPARPRDAARLLRIGERLELATMLDLPRMLRPGDLLVVDLLDRAVTEVLPVDLKDNECNNVGCKGLGEPAHVPTAAAIANAVYDAIGVRPTDSPIDSRMILELLGKKKRG